jgi:pyruvate-ferredoxin/flavodoxin oxidoreductase
MELPLTFADFALTEARFRKQFRKAPPESWTEDMLQLAEYIELDSEERDDVTPFIWAVDRENRLIRVIPAEPVVQATEERRDFWLTIREIAEAKDAADLAAIEENARQSIVKQIASGLKELVMNGKSSDIAALLLEEAPAVVASNVAQAPRTSQAPPGTLAPPPAPDAAPDTEKPAVTAATAGDNGYLPPWIDVEGCTSCDECINLNSKIFAYNDKKQAYIKDPKGGPYKDIVRAAEKCTAKIVHPGYPEDRSAKGIGKLIKRAEKFM